MCINSSRWIWNHHQSSYFYLSHLASYHLHGYATDTSKIHHLLPILPIDIIQALTEEIDGKKIPAALNASCPEFRDSFPALDQGV